MLVTAAPTNAADILTPKKSPTPVDGPPRVATGGWLMLGIWWALAMGYVALTAYNHHRVAIAADRLEALYRAAAGNDAERGICAPYAAEQPPVMFDPDSHCWINLTQRQIASGTVRPHDFPYDNAPYGRQRHWSSSFSWWLIAVGAATHWWTGMPLAQAVGQSAAWANPILNVLFLSGLALVFRRRLNAWQNGIFLVTLAALSGVEWDFSYGRPDHHGLHLMAFLGLLLGAMTAGLGWVQSETITAHGEGKRQDDEVYLVRPRARSEARFWFTVSGLCGGFGLWVGSTQQCVCIGVLGIGIVVGTWLFARPVKAADTCRFEPELWRHWARVGAGTSLFFYLIEYFPAHMEVHLEVNHPLTALGWLGAGELMYVLLMLKVDWLSTKQRAKEMGLRAALGLLGMAALPLALKLGPDAWCVLGDPILRRAFRVISEGKPLIQPPTLTRAVREFWTYTGALTLSVPIAVFILIVRRRHVPPWQLASLMAMLATVGMFLAWTLVQSRWVGFLETSLAVLSLLAAPALPLPAWLTRRVAVVPLTLLALTVPGWVGFGLVQVDTLAEDPMIHAKTMSGEMMGMKEAAWNLRWYANKFGTQTPCRVMAAPGPGPVLHYYGGVDVVGSYYWENIAGCRVSVDFFMDQGDATACFVARERQLDFVLVTSRPAFVLELQWLQLGHTDLAAARRSLAFRLTNPMGARPPVWLEEVPLLDAPLAREEGIRIYRVVKERL